jgi:hypothetical protein
MKCDDAIRHVLSKSPPYDSETLQHLETCPECRAVAETRQAVNLIRNKSFSPDPTADLLICREAERFTAERLATRKRNRILFPILATAACFCIGAWSLLSRFTREPVAGGPVQTETSQEIAFPGFAPEMIRILELSFDETHPAETVINQTVSLEYNSPREEFLSSFNFQESLLEIEIGMQEVKDALRQTL